MADPAPPEPATTRSADLAAVRVPWYLWPNLLSLDAVAVALVWLWAFSICRKVPVLSPIYVLLGLVVWIVYSFDRLVDAWRMRDASLSTPRHCFAKRSFVPLALVCAVALGCAIWLALFKLQAVLIYHGVLIAAMVGLYFVLRCSPESPLQRLLPKEVFCGVVFALGSTYVVHALPNNFVGGVLTAEMGLFALLCALNCTAISCWEWREDEANDGATIVRSWPAVRTGYVKLAFVLAALAAWVGVRSMPNLASPILLSIALSAALIGALGLLERTLSRNSLRVMADVALLSPLIVIPLMR